MKINSIFSAVGIIRFMMLCLSLSLIVVPLQLYPKSLIAMCAPFHLSPTKPNIEEVWKEPDAVAAVHCFCLWYTLSREYVTVKKVNKLWQKLLQKNKLAHWGQLSRKMNSLIWLEPGNTRLHKGAQSIKWEWETYWHCMIRVFHPFCAT